MIRVGIIGSGVSGMALSIRLASMGFHVEVFEKNTTYGGKLSELRQSGFRFDKGPSLFTMPDWIEELREICGYSEKLDYIKHSEHCRYFWEDGTHLCITDDNEYNHQVFSELLKEKKLPRYLHTLSKKMFLASPVFLESGIHSFKHFFRKEVLYGIFKLPFFRPWLTLDAYHKKFFKNPKSIQIFNRYATYIGSSPYQTSHMNGLAAWPEWMNGVYFPKKGMRGIADYLYAMAVHCGVKFHFNEAVKKININRLGHANQIQTLSETFRFDAIVSAMDYEACMKHLVDAPYQPDKFKEKSSSAWIFYLGVKGHYPNLGLHNILFSNDYQKEFHELFDLKKIPDDPTVYIHISSRLIPSDAPPGHENWFVMINAPSVTNRSSIDENTVIEIIRKKILKVLRIDIRDLCVYKSCWNPDGIEFDTGSVGGAIYGANVHGVWKGWIRPSNKHSKIKNLYFCSGSVHPGGGIPLCLKSAQITADLINKDYA
ncbi:MAG: phytoene desaturase family protein [Bacteroidia bacterium]|nr:phytoene desaturase family protein [Bacteroidia bacterium]